MIWTNFGRHQIQSLKIKLRKPFIINNLEVQYDIQDRRKVYQILEEAGIEIISSDALLTSYKNTEL